MKKFYVFGQILVMFAFFSILIFQVKSQNVVNNGNGIVINQGAWLVIGGNYINQTGGQDGFVDIDGKMVVNRDFINNSAHEVFINIEAAPDGEVILNGVAIQNISGTTSTRFENLTIQNSRKVLQTDFCQVAGRLNIHAILDLNSNTFVIDNSSPQGITYSSGYILAETTPDQGLGIILWNIENSSGNFAIPFGTGNSANNDLDLNLSIQTSGSDEGFMSFSTYPTSTTNFPLPPGISSLDPFDPAITVDRFWLVQPTYISKPSAYITFLYDYPSAHGINRNTLKAIRHNTDGNSWNDWGPAGDANAAALTVATPIITPQNFYAWWTLSGEEQAEYVYVPNAFSPNGDGVNDEFKPFINGYEPEEYVFYIFDRWGKQIFESNNLEKGWDGTHNSSDCKQDVYVWYVIYSDMNNKIQTLNGIVALIK